MGFEDLTPEQRRELSKKGVAKRRLSTEKLPRSEKPIPATCKRGHSLEGDNLHIGYKTRTSVVTGEAYQIRIISCRACNRLSDKRARERERQQKRRNI